MIPPRNRLHASYDRVLDVALACRRQHSLLEVVIQRFIPEVLEKDGFPLDSGTQRGVHDKDVDRERFARVR